MIIQRKQITDKEGHIRNTNIWNIEIDFTNQKDLEDLLSRLKSQLGAVRSEEGGSKRQRNKSALEACIQIYETDIADLYSGMNLDMTPKYYVYAHCGSDQIAVGKNGISTFLATKGLEHRPFYIGKGTGDRAFDLNRNETHRKVRQNLKSFGKDVNVKIIEDNLTELEALCLESKLIDMLGIIGKGGKLVNLDEGVKPNERRSKYSKPLSEIHSVYRDSLKVIDRNQDAR
jgi:hypothetical protein